jgi:hypothetical protein
MYAHRSHYFGGFLNSSIFNINSFFNENIRKDEMLAFPELAHITQIFFIFCIKKQEFLVFLKSKDPEEKDKRVKNCMP